MSRAIHVFRSPDRFVAGTVGQPGDRTFFLQAVHQARVVSVMLEKQQVQILADRIGMLLEEIHRRFGTPIPPDTGEVTDLNPLVMPVDAEFRVGTMGLGWDAEANSVVVAGCEFADPESSASGAPPYGKSDRTQSASPPFPARSIPQFGSKGGRKNWLKIGLSASFCRQI